MHLATHLFMPIFEQLTDVAYSHKDDTNYYNCEQCRANCEKDG